MNARENAWVNRGLNVLAILLAAAVTIGGGIVLAWSYAPK